MIVADEDRERVLAYELGADACLATPFNADVVRARFEGLLREL